MLSWSAGNLGIPVDLRAVVDSMVDPVLPGGRSLLRFVDAVVGGRLEAEVVSGAIDDLGEPAVIAAAAVVSNFQMMNRVADGTGMPVGKGSRLRHAALISELGLDRFDHLGDPDGDR